MNRWCAAPVNPHSTAHEIESDLSSVGAQVIIVKEGENIDAALAAAEALHVTVLLLRSDKHTCGLFTLEPRIDSHVNLRSSKRIPANTLTDKVLVLHTSGTSGNKKLVPYTLENLCVGVGCIVLSWNLGPNDVNLNMMPLFHIGGIVRNLCAPIFAGGATICCSGFDAVLFWEVLEESPSHQRFTWYYAAPTMHMAILHEASRRREANQSVESASSVRMIANAAGGLLPVLADQLLALFGAVVLPSYGALVAINLDPLTECRLSQE
jgi:acyl-CoA synthetase (AMP-forming)/AMP-acid ligase II